MNKTLAFAILKLLRPLVRVLLKNGVSYGEFTELAKQSFVMTAELDYQPESRKQSVSRIAMMTGITRKEVSRIRGQQSTKQTQETPASGPQLLSPEPYNRGVRIISGWNRDVIYHDHNGKPRMLPLEEKAGSFAQLVKKYSGDIPARAALDELVRVGAVTIPKPGYVSLSHEGTYVPDNSQDAKIEILGNSVADLLGTLEHNLNATSNTTHLQLTTAYDNLPRSAVDAFRKLSRKDAKALLANVDRWLGQRDRDASSVNSTSDNDSRMRLGIGIYYIEEDMTSEKKI